MEVPTPYKVSTITATAFVCSKLDIAVLFRDVALAASFEEAGVIRCEFIDENKQPVSRGADVRKANRRRNSKKKRFENQATFLIRPTAQAPNIVNTKVFRNGNVQMTGNKSYEDGVRCVELLIAAIRGVPGAAASPDDLRVDNYLIRLINSDFRVPFRINNPVLQRAMMTSDYVSIYEPCIYPGVKILYYYRPDRASGRCGCHPHCGGKSCKKITIAVFQSGAVIITGAIDMVMLDVAYAYTAGMLVALREKIEQKSMSALVSKMAAALGKPRDQNILNFCTARAKAATCSPPTVK